MLLPPVSFFLLDFNNECQMQGMQYEGSLAVYISM